MKNFIRNIVRRVAVQAFPEFRALFDFIPDIPNSVSVNSENSISDHAKLDKPCRMYQSAIGDYSYVAVGSRISQTTIGKFCSIGPNFLCGWGIHPINGISTSPTFYSATSYNGFSLAVATKIEERKPVSIGNDVFIGANVTILDGVTIADGAVIGAGAVVANDIPPYAIVAGVPGRVIRYRFDQDTIDELLTIKWWDWNKDQLQSVEEHFFDVKKFTAEFKKG